MTVGLIVLVAIIIFAVYQYKKKKSEQIEARDDDIDNDVLERNQGRENSQMNIGGGANTKVLYNWLKRNKINFEIWNHMRSYSGKLFIF